MSCLSSSFLKDVMARFQLVFTAASMVGPCHTRNFYVYFNFLAAVGVPTHIYTFVINPEPQIYCIHTKNVLATRKLGKNGDGSIPSSCMNCNPTLSDCYFDCQALIDQVYVTCDDICLPDGYYFDPQSTMSGCFKSNLPELKIQIERCGCNSAWKKIGVSSFQLFFTCVLSISFTVVFIW